MPSNGSQMKRLFRTMLVTGSAFTVNYLINLFLTPFITSNVGTAAYGYVSLAKNLAQYATIITLALNSFAARHIAVAYHNRDLKTANIYFSSTFFGDVVLGVLILCVSLFCIASLERLLVIPHELIADVKLLFIFVLLTQSCIDCTFHLQKDHLRSSFVSHAIMACWMIVLGQSSLWDCRCSVRTNNGSFTKTPPRYFMDQRV